MGAPVDVLVAGLNLAARPPPRDSQASRRVRVADNAIYAHGVAEPLAALSARSPRDHNAIVAPATAFAKNVLPRVAALLDVMQISDIVKVVAPKTFDRPIYAGNAIQTVKSTDAKIVATVRTAAFAATGKGGSGADRNGRGGGRPGLSRFVGQALAKTERPELSSAKNEGSGGRRCRRRRTSSPTSNRSPTTGAAIGASRAAVDAGYAPNDWQVGQTGKVVAPDL